MRHLHVCMKINSLHVFKFTICVNQTYILKWRLPFPRYLYKWNQWIHYYYIVIPSSTVFNLIHPEFSYDVLCQAWVLFKLSYFFWIRILDYFPYKYRQSVCKMSFIYNDNSIWLHVYAVCVKTCTRFPN